ncbi:neurogenic protein big brain-like isoform X1 [Schistocerca americana]|uniref:neurogenic protein big brain-like isoform X1 n=2 Tax=Schistocerca TaxID=7008 RepID=UPI001F4F4DDD|nr:neurogenic protein big brain-like isoform X1 [Schistocerca americana]
MATGVLPPDTTLEFHLVTLFEKLEAARLEAACAPGGGAPSAALRRPSMQAEVRTLEFWRSIISECLASFFYVFIVCGGAAAAVSGPAAGGSPLLLTTAIATGLAVATLTHCFGHISGAHANPAVTAALLATRRVSVLRAAMFVAAQCGGGIAGAALLYGVTLPASGGGLVSSSQSPVLSTLVSLPPHFTAWEGFGVEFILTFVVVFTYCVSMDSYRRWLGGSSVSIGMAYLACSLVSTPSLNPARALGPAFVMNKWEDHWVHWLGPILGGIVSGLIYEYIFNPRRHFHHQKESIDGDSSSIHSDEDPYDELEKPSGPKFNGSTYNTLRATDLYRSAVNQAGPPTPASPTGPGNAYCPSLTTASLYSAPPCKLDRVESLYGGTKSLYAKSPPLTRANLNRSQSVYSKVPSGPACAQRDGLPRPGPLVPAQSLYPMRFNQNLNVTNQNAQNQQSQLQQRSDSIYGVRGVATVASRPEAGGVYGVSQCSSGTGCNTGTNKYGGGSARPESMYGIISRRQDSADSSYGSYHSGGGASTANSSSTRGGVSVNGATNSVNTSGPPSYTNNKCSSSGATQGFNPTRNELRQSPQHQLLSPNPTSVVNPTNSVASYHQNQRHSPNTQY